MIEISAKICRYVVTDTWPLPEKHQSNLFTLISYQTKSIRTTWHIMIYNVLIYNEHVSLAPQGSFFFFFFLLVKGDTKSYNEKSYWIKQKSVSREDGWNWREEGLEAAARQCKAAKFFGKLGTALQWNEFCSVLWSLFCPVVLKTSNCPVCYSGFYLWWK